MGWTAMVLAIVLYLVLGMFGDNDLLIHTSAVPLSAGLSFQERF
jgi:hypothetical protein